MSSSDQSRQVWQSWLRLTLSEAGRMVRHPAFVASAVVVAVPWLIMLVTRGVEEFPVLTNASWQVQMPMLIVAAGSYFTANLIAVRGYRFSTTQTENVQPMPRWAQIAAQFTAVSLLGVVAATMTLTHLLVLSTSAGAGGSILLSEAAAAPATVVLAATLGVTVGHLGRSLASGAVTFGVAGVIALAGLIDGRSWRWLSLVALEDNFSVPAVPAQVADRPATWHLLWLLALVVVAATLTLLMRGISRRLGLTVLATATAVAVLAGYMQITAVPLQQTTAWRDGFNHPDRQQDCEVHGSVTYCAFPDFTSRIGAWDQMVQAQIDALPVGTTAAPFFVRQRLSMPSVDGIGFALPVEQWDADDDAANTPQPVPVSTRWAGANSDSYDQTQVLAFALGVAQQLTTGDRAPIPAAGGGAIALCGGPGLVKLWLATGTNEAGRHAVKVVLDHGDLVEAAILDSSTTFLAGFAETELLTGLLAQDASKVTAAIHANWTELLDPETSIHDAAALLGVEIRGELPEDVGLCA